MSPMDPPHSQRRFRTSAALACAAVLVLMLLLAPTHVRLGVETLAAWVSGGRTPVLATAEANGTYHTLGTLFGVDRKSVV